MAQSNGGLLAPLATTFQFLEAFVECPAAVHGFSGWYFVGRSGAVVGDSEGFVEGDGACVKITGMDTALHFCLVLGLGLALFSSQQKNNGEGNAKINQRRT